jgi:hypothetical protein
MGNNFKEMLQKALTNKNTLTILVVFAGIIGLYAVYNWRVTEAITPVKVPYAKKEISSRTQITTDMISYTEVPKSLLTNASNIVKSSSALVGKYVNYGCTVPQYSFFYSDYILNTTSNPTSEFANIPDNYTIYSLAVDFDSTYGNSIYPGNYIDLYIKIKQSSDNRIIFGRLIKGIQVMSVVDSDGNNVFESSTESRKPKYMFFAVPNNLYLLLKKAEYINATIMPIPRNASYSSETKTPEIDSTYIQNYILSKAVNFNE